MSVETCPYCDGKGITYGPRVAERKKCRTCGGTGLVITCSFCRGTGWSTSSGLFNSSKKCPYCDGKGHH